MAGNPAASEEEPNSLDRCGRRSRGSSGVRRRERSESPASRSDTGAGVTAGAATGVDRVERVGGEARWSVASFSAIAVKAAARASERRRSSNSADDLGTTDLRRPKPRPSSRALATGAATAGFHIYSVRLDAEVSAVVRATTVPGAFLHQRAVPKAAWAPADGTAGFS